MLSHGQPHNKAKQEAISDRQYARQPLYIWLHRLVNENREEQEKHFIFLKTEINPNPET